MGSVWNQRYAQYASGSGTDTLVFEYTVVEKDRDDNGVAAFVPHGLDIKASGTDIAYQPNPDGETPEMPENSNHKVNGSLVDADTTSPTVSSLSFVDPRGPGADSTYGAGDWIGVSVTFSETVVVGGADGRVRTLSARNELSRTHRVQPHGVLRLHCVVGHPACQHAADRTQGAPLGSGWSGSVGWRSSLSVCYTCQRRLRSLLQP